MIQNKAIVLLTHALTWKLGVMPFFQLVGPFYGVTEYEPE